MPYKKTQKYGFTLVETLVGAAVFLIVAVAAYNAYVGLFKLINLNQYRVLAIALANEQFEIARNMPYGDVGIVGSIPVGKIQHSQTLTRGGVSFAVDTIVRSIDIPFDGTIGGSPNDTSPADNKLVEITVTCSACDNMKPVILSGQVAPKSLETSSGNGALFVRVFDANGQPVQGANVHIVNVATTTTIVIDDVTDANGILQLVDVPPGVNAYRITVTKSGYSTDKTYPIGGTGNPNPTKPDVTVIVQQVTQISFAIDKLSTLNIFSITPACVRVGGMDFSLVGSKQIGANLPKYSATKVTDSGGNLTLSNMEWDQYTINSTDTSYDIVGLSPENPIALNPGISQDQLLVVSDRPPTKSLLVTVKDKATSLPISNIKVGLKSHDSDRYNKEIITGQGYMKQTDWVGGAGQEKYIDQTKYWTDDNNIESIYTAITLKKTGDEYNANGVLESSTFDVGTTSNFFYLTRWPTDEPAQAGADSVKIQLASNASSSDTTWSFKGPDGTSNTYYTAPTSAIGSHHDGKRYIRYRVYLSTTSTTTAPTVSDIFFSYSSECTPPGQVLFNGLASGLYDVYVYDADNNQVFNETLDISSTWVEKQVLLEN